MGKNTLYLGVFGSREGFHPDNIDKILNYFVEDDTFIITGCAKGVDAYVRKWCEKNLPDDMWRVFKANWNTHGKKAGYLRNRQAVKFLAARRSMLILFWDGQSSGTQMNFKLATEFGMGIFLFPPKFFTGKYSDLLK